MPLNARLRHSLERTLSVVKEHEASGARLLDDANRLWLRIQKFIRMDLVGPDVQKDAMELACYALQLPAREVKTMPTGRLGRTNVRERVEQSAELLVSLLGDDIEESLLDRTTHILHEIPRRSTALDEARLLTDALGLDDFGVSGMVLQTVQLARQGEGLSQLIEGCEKREQYGYWGARLRDGFHFEPVRQIARRRLASARELCKLLKAEADEDTL